MFDFYKTNSDKLLGLNGCFKSKIMQNNNEKQSVIFAWKSKTFIVWVDDEDNYCELKYHLQAIFTTKKVPILMQDF